MKAKFKITNPDNAECTLTITMPLEKWKRLREQLDSNYPSWKLSNLIAQLVSKVQEECESEGEFEE